MGYRGMGHMGNGVQGMGYMSNGVQGYGAHGQWDTGGNGVQGYRAHGQWGIPGPRLLVARSYDTYIGWANFDPQTHSSINGDEDSRYFLAVYAQEDNNNNYFILSLQVRDSHPFLTEHKYGNDSFMYRSVSHQRNLQLRNIAK